jgi:uncharacterized short protein YbdD (DUF466 family)
MSGPAQAPAAAAREARFLATLRAAIEAGAPGGGLFDAPDPVGVGEPAFHLAPLGGPVAPRPAGGRWALLQRLSGVIARAWRFTRELSGDDAYERYLEHVARFHPGQPPMTRGEHYRFLQDEKWSRLSRCC